jgi:hypothetical protein
MDVTVAYHGRSEVTRGPAGLAVSLEPNLRRDRVGFDGTSANRSTSRPISALHDVVISDLQLQAEGPDRVPGYLKVLKRARTPSTRRRARLKADEVLKEFRRRAANYQEDYSRKSVYWNARRSTPTSSRSTTGAVPPRDAARPVCTVAPTHCCSVFLRRRGRVTVCLSVSRDAFTAEKDVALNDERGLLVATVRPLPGAAGYRKTRFPIDPAGFGEHGVGPDIPRRKIALPEGWLRLHAGCSPP